MKSHRDITTKTLAKFVLHGVMRHLGAQPEFLQRIHILKQVCAKKQRLKFIFEAKIIFLLK